MSQPFVHTLTPRFSDLDVYNHVNNAVYLTYFEEARIALMNHIGLRSLFTRRQSTVIAHAEVDYRAPAHLGDVLDIAVTVGAIRNSSYELHYRITRRSDGALIATGKTVQVCYNFELNCPTRLPQEWRAILQRLVASSDALPLADAPSDRAVVTS
ncbi:MAG: acyl-CoA thioesterase [Thermoflexales bacterium]|nr:acyl-CoA thioesterase [Thermoflexales bacterium]MCX7938579.1 acyl-CoA thioesterase [Thermoflexales bacterium]MDW8292099.1 thioesterase family protein [Anaerolineae bacterium]